MTTLAKVINQTPFQQPVPIKDEYGNKDSVLLQPGARVELPNGFVLDGSLPAGVYYTPPTVSA